MSAEKDTRDNNEGKRNQKQVNQLKNTMKKGSKIPAVTKSYNKTKLNEINKQLNNVMKTDDSGLRIMMEDIVKEMKDELLKSVIGRIELLQQDPFLKNNRTTMNLEVKIDNLKQTT